MTFGRIIILVVVLAIISYLGLHLQGLLSPPPLTLTTPADGLITSNRTLEINGETAPGAQVKINGSSLPIPQTGKFSHTLVLTRGINTIAVSARKRYSKPAVIKRQVLILQSGERISQAEGVKI